MSRTIAIIEANGDTKAMTMDRKLTLTEMQKIVGGLIEYVPLPDGYGDIVVNEEGLLMGLPINTQATEMMRAAWLERHDPSTLNFDMMVIVGTAIVIPQNRA